MKVSTPPDNNLPLNPASAGNAQKASQATASQQAVARTQQSAAAPAAGVSVSVSSSAQAMGSAKPTGAGDFDAKKVESIKAALKDGTYKVNPEAIADKLLSSSKELFQQAA